MRATSEMQVFTVTELTRQIKLLLENGIPTIWLQGEMSNFTHHPSGHMYFTLKDEHCQIKCVMWREQAIHLFFTPQDGMKVRAQGEVTVYERAGQYQLRARQLQPAGIGELQLAFEQLKEKLLKEGLFDKGRKRPIPSFPRTIGVITSPVGAAIRDIVQISRRRFPGIRILVCPVRVQGEGAAAEIAAAIDDCNRCGGIEVLILARGGGSLEDLWAFNEEVVARAISASAIPVVSAVGHEIDFTISDFVADLRAPTPSAAAEMVVPDRREFLQAVAVLSLRSRQQVERALQRCQDRLKALLSSYGLCHPMDIVRQSEQRRDEALGRLGLNLTQSLRGKEHELALLSGKLEGLDPRAVLKRGYSICCRYPQRTIIREAGALQPGDEIEVSLYRGHIRGVVQSVRGE